MYKVIIADDEEWVIENLKIAVKWEQYGFQVVDTALDGVAAMEKIEKWKPQVVFTDIRMPGINGLELMKRVSEKSQLVYFVVISGFAEFAYAQKAMDYGTVGYCLKPLEEDDITRILEKLKTLLDAHPDLNWGAKGLSRTGMERSSPDFEKIKNETAREMVKYVYENFQKNITLMELSEKFNIHYSYVSQLFRKETGQGFLEYLIGWRMEYACKMLQNTTLSVNEIAEKTGYEDSLYFRKVFKTSTGKTPTEYREESVMEKNRPME